MSSRLRGYQSDLRARVDEAWTRVANVLVVSATGSGKSVMAADAMAAEKRPSVFIAHRSELVSQASLALAREGLRHRVIGPDSLRRVCVAVQMESLGRNFTDPNAHVAVAGVDTLVRMPADDPWFRQVALWVCDEAHHLCYSAKNEPNKWARAVLMFPNARGLGYTATPLRADGKGLGRSADGLFDVMVEGPPMRALIDAGYLCDYRLFAPPNDIDLSGVSTSASGDFSPDPLRKAVHKSHVVGDVVTHYQRVAAGKLGMTFCVDVEGAAEVAATFRAAGIPSEVISGDTPAVLRAQIMRRFRQREILQLVSVDILGEGTDVPAVEVVSFARPTQSYGLYVQQFGRALRILDGKGRAIILDHVGNIARHGLPDARREWTLDRREKRARSAVNDAIPTRVCLNESCMSVYERALASCPYCGTAAPPANGRSSPEQVDGDLAELDETALRALRGEISRVDGAPVYPMGAGREVQGAIFKRHTARATAQASLRNAMALWGGWQQSLGRDEREAQRRFFHRYRIDVGTAQTLGEAEAQQLQALVEAELAQIGVTNAPRP